ncbi:MAG: alpha-galactosidase [Deltaproteobacteria bacterium]|nr:alpha-galactosidase [Deltaproteobacteria bacterium]
MREAITIAVVCLAACGGGSVNVDPDSGHESDAGAPDAASRDAGKADGGVVIGEDGGTITAGTGVLEIAIDQDRGSVDLKDLVNGVKIERLHLGVEVPAGPRSRVFTTVGKKFPCTEGGFGSAVTFSCSAETGSGFKASVTMTLDPAKPDVLGWESSFENVSTSPVTVRKFHPFRAAESAGSSVFVGDDPAKVRVLQNGSDGVVDFYVFVNTGDKPLSDPEQNALLSPYSSYSSGSAVAYDLASGASFLAGFTDFEWAIPLVAMAGNTASMTEMWGEARFPWDVEIPPGKTISGGAAVFVAGTKTPFDALERYAGEVAARKQIALPPAPLSGWDSWYTGIGDDLTEEYVRQNADALSEKFLRFGLASMQLDSGWNDTWGDWNAGGGFPSGMRAAADYVKSRGLTPEIWMAPLSAAEDSQAWLDHEDWFLPKDVYGDLLMSKDMHPFDLSNPGVIDYVRTLGAKIGEWGFESVKMDFAYYTLLSVLPPDPDKTNVALYRNAIREYRAAVGQGVHFINIAMCFPNYGLVDAFRTGLDTWPCWDGGADCPDHGGSGISAPGIKPGVRMAARRYWMNGRIWWNHNDQLFFRDISEEEARAWASVASLSGGMISLGEDASGLTSRQADIYRRILPLSGATARPLDLFARETPEIWHMAQTDPNEGHVLALFNWGANKDLTTNPYTDRPDGPPVTHSIDLASLGMDPDAEFIGIEFWTGQVIPSVKGTFVQEIAPHTSRVYRFVKKTDKPAYLSTDRHLLMGPGFIKGASYNAATRKYTGTVRTTTEHTQTMYVAVPPGFSDIFSQIDGVKDPSSGGPADGVYFLTFTGQDNDWHTFEVTFNQR